MQSKDTRFPIEVGRVSIDLKQGKYIRLRWTIGTERTQISFGSYTQDRLDAAIAIARIIESDIVFGRYDYTKAKYDPNPKRPIAVANPVAEQEKKILTVPEAWEIYKEHKIKIGEDRSNSCDWKLVDRSIESSQGIELTDEQIEELVNSWLDTYAKSTTLRLCEMLRAAVTIAKAKKKCNYNPFIDFIKLTFDKKKQNEIKAFTLLDVDRILDAFEYNRYQSVYSEYEPSYYWHYVKFRTLTGCRPSEAIALTWNDLKFRNDGKTFINFSKAHVNGVTRNETKTGVIREFPCNEQVTEFLHSIPKTHDKIVFPSVGGGYINTGNFSKRYWKPVVQGLVDKGEINEALPFYNLRHTYITELIAAKMDIATVARWVGNSTETILSNYYAGNKTLIPPTL
jgi:integrase